VGWLTRVLTPRPPFPGPHSSPELEIQSKYEKKKEKNPSFKLLSLPSSGASPMERRRKRRRCSLHYSTTK
jgi:hypothetical protein